MYAMVELLQEIQHCQVIHKFSQLLVKEQGKYDLLKLFFNNHCHMVDITKDNALYKVCAHDKNGEVMFCMHLPIFELNNNIDSLLEKILEYCRHENINLIEANQNGAPKPTLDQSDMQSMGNVINFPFVNTRH